MKILALEREVGQFAASDYRPYLEEEARKVYELMQMDILREIYFQGDRNEAVLVLECGDTAEAKAVLAALPLVSNGLITFDLIPLRPYPGFERLMKG